MSKIAGAEKLVFSKSVSLFLFLFFSLHLILTTIYQFREPNYNSYLSRLSKLYSEPLFIQNYKIFAPNVPLATYKLFIRYGDNAKQLTPWIAHGAALLNAHQQNRFSPAGYEYLLYKNAVNELVHSKEQVSNLSYNGLKKGKISYSQIDSSISKSISFYRASYYFYHQWKLEFPNKKFPAYFECALLLENIQNVEGSNKTAVAAYRFLFFPLVKFNG